MSRFITYKIVEDMDDKLKASARFACNFWNHHITPEASVVIHVDLFWSPFGSIAYADEPVRQGTVIHGRVRFNSVYVRKNGELQLASAMAHEIGHTLGIGWERWMDLFDTETGRFTEPAIDRLPALEQMRVETGSGPSTQYVHWDEGRHGGELMTGHENKSEYVLPVTVDVLGLLGHQVERRLEAKTPIKTLLAQLQSEPFHRKEEARTLASFDFRPLRFWERVLEVLPARTALMHAPSLSKGGRARPLLRR